MSATKDKDPNDRSECTPCHGTGKLSSNKGGTKHEVTCPWCEGKGAFETGHDAQEAGVKLRGDAA